MVSIKVHKAHKVQVALDKVAAYRNSTDHRTKEVRVDLDRRHRTVSIKDRVASAKAVAHLNNTELLLRARSDKTEPHRHNMVHHNPPAPVIFLWFRFSSGRGMKTLHFYYRWLRPGQQFVTTIRSSISGLIRARKTKPVIAIRRTTSFG